MGLEGGASGGYSSSRSVKVAERRHVCDALWSEQERAFILELGGEDDVQEKEGGLGVGSGEGPGGLSSNSSSL